MALVLDSSGFELHALGPMGTKPTERLVAASYADVRSVELGENWLGVWAEVEMDSGERIAVEAGKRGIGAGRDVLGALDERCAGTNVASEAVSA
jgi:hypothetical protein